jgi:hypothetical protein
MYLNFKPLSLAIIENLRVFWFIFSFVQNAIFKQTEDYGCNTPVSYYKEINNSYI